MCTPGQLLGNGHHPYPVSCGFANMLGTKKHRHTKARVSTKRPGMNLMNHDLRGYCFNFAFGARVRSVLFVEI